MPYSAPLRKRQSSLPITITDKETNMLVYRIINNAIAEDVAYMTKEKLGLRLAEIFLDPNVDNALLEWLSIDSFEVK